LRCTLVTELGLGQEQLRLQQSNPSF